MEQAGFRSYDDVPGIGELYDHVGIYAARRDVDLYVSLAREAGGTVLELGCGTGRILIPTARAGVPVVGLDRSDGMLSRCKDKLAAEEPGVRGLVRLVQADMRSFDIGRRFSLITAPFRGFQHLVRGEDQRAFFDRVRAHLEPGGLVAFDVFNPDPARLAHPSTDEHEDTPTTRLPDGRSFRRAARVVSIDMAAHVSNVELTYYVRDRSGDEARLVQAFPMRWHFPDELEQIVTGCGFVIRAMYGDTERSPLTPSSPDIIVVASPAS